MPQKCRVKHMCIGLLEQAWGDRQAQSALALPAVPMLFVQPSHSSCSSIQPAIGREGCRMSSKIPKENPKQGEATQ